MDNCKRDYLLELELRATRTRLEAVSRDWYRMRDVEAQWRRLSRVLYAVSIVLGVAAVAVLGGA